MKKIKKETTLKLNSKEIIRILDSNNIVNPSFWLASFLRFFSPKDLKKYKLVHLMDNKELDDLFNTCDKNRKAFIAFSIIQAYYIEN